MTMDKKAARGLLGLVEKDRDETGIESVIGYLREHEGAVGMVQFFDVLGQDIKALEEPLKRKKKLHDLLRKGLIPEQFEREDIETVRVAGVGTAYLSTRLFASIITAVHDKAFTWLRKNDLGDLISNTVNSSALSSSFKDRVAAGQSIPEALFHVHYETRVSVKKA
jgi:hypothetical protein